MDKSARLQPSNTKSSLQELFLRTRATMEPPVPFHLRRPEADAPAVDVVEPRPLPPEHFSEPVVERRRQSPARPSRKTSSSNVLLEPVLPQPYVLSYAFVLVPRFTAHYLIGDIAESLRDWMHRLCTSFDWRLESISIRPEYMQWVITVRAADSPSGCIRKIRQFTSRKIFDDFPHIREENISDDFWAPGNSVLLGPTAHPIELINDYIHLTRQQQGSQPRLRD